MKICIILGTRPEIIKLCSIIKHCEKNKFDYFVIHTNQHYSENMDKIFFEELELPLPKYHLNIGSGLHGEQTGKALIAIERVLLDERPDIVLVEGDTNTVLAGALAAHKLHIKVGHVEAGLRSYDRRMPEEANRIMTDHIADYLFAPTRKQEHILLEEGVSKEKIFVVGNTIVDAVLENSRISQKLFDPPKESYFLVTAHRSENVDDRETLMQLLESLDAVAQEYQLQIIYPIHPRTRKMIQTFNIATSNRILLTEPIGYLEFLHLTRHAKLVLTDSGGLQEESCILQVPCVTLRDNTERPETVDVGANVLAGVRKENVLKAVSHMLSKEREWTNPFGDGTTGKKILEIVRGG
ncbi:MAG: UDP-N-acetylglucosamine 2-epimerase (non-hydrolyzing) [archaeon]